MSNLRMTLTTVVLSFLLTTSFLMTLVMVPETVSAYTIRDPIHIDGDAEFTSANGVTGGSGTASDPYIIEGWEIDATTAHGIWIQDTSAHFTIRNCYIHDSGGDLFGIYLLRCINGTVTGNNCSNSNHGIYLSSSSNNTLSDNNCTNSNHGILLSSSSNNALSDNNCSSNNYLGILLSSSSNNALSNNNCSNNIYGIYLDSSGNNTLSDNNCSLNDWYGIYLFSSSNDNTLSNNNCSNNNYGIYLSSSGNNTLSDNNCSLNDWYGILLSSSSNNTLSDNNCSNNNHGIYLFSSSNNNTLSNNSCSDNDDGILLSSSSNNTLSNNSCSDNYLGILLYSSSNDNTLSNNNCSSNNNYGIRLSWSSNDNTLSNNSCSDNDDGIRLDSSSNNALSDNNCSDNDYGIYVIWSSNNTLSDNNCSSNGLYGVYLSDSTGTTAYHNIFFDNIVDHAYDNRGSENSWNSSYPFGGNYWDDYTGVDEFSGPDQDQPGPDGIGDTPYVIDANSTDYYPLMEPLPNTPPIASFTVSPSTGYVNTVFSVDASSSSDAEDDLSVLEVRWDWESDGAWDTSWSVVKTDTHQYSAEGTHTIKLEARDTKGLTDNTTRQITVVPDDVPPVADAGPNQTVTVGEEVTFDGSDSSDDVGIVNYTWAFTYDDEARELYGVGPTFTFDIAGTYIVTLTVEDAEDETGTDTVTITVEEEEEQDDDEKGFIETYGLPLGIVVALAIIALILFLVLKGRKGGKAPTSPEEPPATEPVD